MIVCTENNNNQSRTLSIKEPNWVHILNQYQKSVHILILQSCEAVRWFNQQKSLDKLYDECSIMTESVRKPANVAGLKITCLINTSSQLAYRVHTLFYN